MSLSRLETPQRPILAKKDQRALIADDLEVSRKRLEGMIQNKPIVISYFCEGKKIDKESIKALRRQGGDFEYTKIREGRKETRKDITCENDRSAMDEASYLLRSFHKYLINIDIADDIDLTSPQERIRMPQFGLEFTLSLDRSGQDKYNISFLGKHIGELLYHPDGHGEEFGDKNASLPHYNLVFDNHPKYGSLHTHLTLSK